MLNINFLPWRDQQRFKNKKRQIILIGIILLLCFFIMGGIIHQFKIEKNIFENQIALLTQYNQQLNKQKQSYESLNKTNQPTKFQPVLQEPAVLERKSFNLHYLRASDAAKLLKDKDHNLLSKNGYLIADDRTNILFIEDLPKNLFSIQQFLKTVDVNVPQILIEARIVNIDDDQEEALGVRFGLTGGRHLSGSLQGANQMMAGVSPADVKPEDRLNVDLPADINHAGSLGLALVKLAPGTLLDLELSALESEDHAEIISRPKLFTANQQTAIIESGEEIPYEESAGEGATTTAFKKAVLSLQVTPQITLDHHIILRIKLNQDQVSDKEVKGVPAIDTRKITTQVLLDNGQTVVLGGIYEQVRRNNIERVPFFGNLPIIGILFRHHKTANNKRELLIFVTPRIINVLEKS